MYIPKTLLTQRYYVAVRETTALSSWRTLDEAIDCVSRFKEHAPYDFSKIKGIIEVTSEGRKWVHSDQLIGLLDG